MKKQHTLDFLLFVLVMIGLLFIYSAVNELPEDKQSEQNVSKVKHVAGDEKVFTY